MKSLFLATGVIYLLIEMNNKNEYTSKAFIFNKLYKIIVQDDVEKNGAFGNYLNWRIRKDLLWG